MTTKKSKSMSREFVGKKRSRELTCEITRNFLDPFHSMSDAELRAVIKRARGFTSSNCWWGEYHLQLPIIYFAEDELRTRKIAKRERKNPNT
jgi:hypothetical protein